MVMVLLRESEILLPIISVSWLLLLITPSFINKQLSMSTVAVNFTRDKTHDNNSELNNALKSITAGPNLEM